MVSLSVYYANAASTTVTTANQLYTTLGTSVPTSQSYTVFGTGLGWVQLASQGQTMTPLGSIGSPDGKGFLWDATTLEGQTLAAGNYSGIIRLNASQFSGGTGNPQAGTLTADIVVRVYKRSSGGTYTLIASMTLTAQSITSAFVSYSLPSSAGSATAFASGEKLYIDCWANVTANANGSSVQGIRLNRLSTDTTTFTGDSEAVINTPGYSSSNTSFTLYGSNVANGTLATASSMSTATGGTETSVLTNATGVAVWVEVLSRAASIATVSAIGSPSGKGWAFAPGAGTIAAGNWAASVTLSASSPGTTDVTIRFYKYSSGTYTSIGTINKTGVTGTKTTYSFAATSFSSVTFGSSDLLYTDLWWHDTSGADDNPVCYVSSSASAGVAGDMQVTTPNFTPAGTTTSLAVTETATGSETVNVTSINLMSIIEAATGTEIVNVSTVPGNAQLITEFAPGSETVSTFTYYRASITETPSSSEAVKATAIKLTSVSETGAGSETVKATAVVVSTITEAAPGTGTATSRQYNVVFASVTEAAPGSEIVLTSAITVSPGNVQMTAADMAFQYQRIMTSAAGPLLQILASVYYGNSTNSQTIYGELDALLKSETIDQLHEMRLIDDVTAFLRAYNYATTVQADQPISYYRLGESSGALANDIAGRSFNATINGGVTLKQPGALAVSTDTAMLLNGSTGYLALPFGVNPTNWSGLTLELWVKLTNNSFVNYPRMVANEQSASSEKGFDLALAPSSDGNSGYFEIGFGGTYKSLAFGPGVLAAGSWYHIACTWNGATMTAYINAVSVGTLAASGNLAATTNLINIGRNPVTGDYLPGAIDEVAIYNYALSAGRIAAHYSAAINP